MSTEQRDYAELLAFAKTKCPACEGKGNVEERAYPPGQAVTTCSNCEGTCLVHLFPDESGVRVKCSGWNGAVHLRDPLLWGNPSRPCTRCGDLNYVVLDPVTGGDTWAKALWPLLQKLKIPARDFTYVPPEVFLYQESRYQGDTPAALEAAYQALLAVGIVKKESP